MANAQGAQMTVRHIDRRFILKRFQAQKTQNLIAELTKRGFIAHRLIGTKIKTEQLALETQMVRDDKHYRARSCAKNCRFLKGAHDALACNGVRA